MTPTHLDLCSGIGCFAIAANLAGYETIAFCECDEFCQRVLRKHWPGVPIYDDLRWLTAADVADAADYGRAQVPADARAGYRAGNSEAGQQSGSRRLDATQGSGEQLAVAVGNRRRRGRDGDAPRHGGEVQTAGSRPLVDLLTGGIPCQPASLAGKRKGSADDRWLWPDAIRVVREIRPRLFLFENVPGLIGLRPHGLDWILGELEGAGYQCVSFVLGADDVGAPHRRKRVWIVGRRMDDASIGGSDRGAVLLQRGRSRPTDDDADRASEGLALAYALGRGGRAHDEGAAAAGRNGAQAAGDGLAVAYRAGWIEQRRTEPARAEYAATECGRAGEPESCLGLLPDGTPIGLPRWPARPGEAQQEWEALRVARGVPERAAKLKALGNAIVWPCAYAIIMAIRDLDGPASTR